MISDLTKKQKITIFSVIALFLLAFLMLFLFIPRGKYGNELGINNYDKYISNLPADRRSAINNTLYKIVNNNSKSGVSDVKDAAIRDGSVEYNYNQDTDVHSGRFIVDIPSIKQSYSISYEWSTKQNIVSGYAATAACLPASQIIYGSFDCKDDFNGSKTSRDPILQYLPYSTFNYTVTASIDDNKKVSLNVVMNLYTSDTRDGNRDKSISKYKTQITDWVKSKGLNPDNYLVQYTINE